MFVLHATFPSSLLPTGVRRRMVDEFESGPQPMDSEWLLSHQGTLVKLLLAAAEA